MVLGIFQRVFPTGSSWSHSSSDTNLSYTWNDEDKNWHITGTGTTEGGFGYNWCDVYSDDNSANNYSTDRGSDHDETGTIHWNYDNYDDGWKAFLAEGDGGGSYHDYYHTDSSSDYSYGFYNSTVTGHDESKTDHKRDENWNVSFDVVNGRAVRETDGDITIIIDESSKYSKSGESHECTETSENVVADPYYWNSYNGTRTTHFKRDANVSDSGEQSYYEKITADWTNHANEQGNLEYKISADSEITVKAKGDYSSYLYEYSDNEFDGCYHYSSSSSGYGCGCGYCCYYSYSYSSNGSLHTYSENERTIDVSEHYDSELHENRHTDGGAFERISFDGFANGGGSSSNPTHQYSEYDYHYDWDDNYCDYHSWGSVDNYNDSTNDTSGSASYDYSADWNWNKDGEKSSSVTNQVSGHRGYIYDSYYDNSSESHCGYSCSSSDSCSYSCTYLDYNESVQYTGWGHQGGQVGSPFSVRWSPFSGSISDGSDCGYGCGCGCGDSGDYSYRSANFHAPNFSVTMTEETYNGENLEYNDVWHPGHGSYYYYYDGYLYSGSAPGSHLPGGSAPGTPSAYGSITVAGIPLNYNGNPNFTNYAFIDPEAILDEKYPKPPEPATPDPVEPPVIVAAGISTPGNYYWEVAAGFFDGLKTGAKAVVNGSASAVSTLVTIGYKTDVELIEVTEKDRQYGYDYAKGAAQIGANAAIAAGTMGLGCAAAQGSRLAGGVVTTIDTLEGLGAARGLVEGATDMVQNGANLNNSVQVVSSVLTFIGLGGKQCFTAGTQVVVGAEYHGEGNVVEYVTVNIEDIKVGDLVYSYDTITGEVSLKEVTDTFVRTSNHINYLTIIDENGNEQIIETTDSHPFWVVTDNPDLDRAAKEIVDENGTILYHDNIGVAEHGYWVEAKDLHEGDVFLGANGELSTLTNIVRVEQNGGITVYNFTVDGNHDYFVIAKDDEFGQTCVLVHNADYLPPPREIVNSNGVKIVRNLDDHGPPHLHVSGQGPKTRIGMNGKPLEGNPKLSPTQSSVVSEHLSEIRNAVHRLGVWHRLNGGR